MEYSILVACFLTFAIFHSSQAQNSPQQNFLNAHNTARRQVGVSPMTWDNRLAAYAQNYANQRIGDCDMIHSHGPYGENLAAAFPQLNAAGAVKMWFDEKKWYDYNSNSCAPGKVCGHYTQVVWRNSVRLGCARVRCNNGWVFITCNYDPPGNYIGQRPYGDLEEQPAFDSKLDLPTDV
ncbi:putative basic form of pathogenesis-related protein 1-like [Capsicum annuum]|uniref:basic form of pathogenesis-related protein 1 n=1 Tax=Capsicum annuum TaxID=4072 RepID=UPI001FB0C284|nr:basic form of pathogenesis-related protein 1 [Capsicum annuum]KAF3649586.1 putative basic form of pathogenesis-related protein 1-like [Capsicum annuum]